MPFPGVSANLDPAHFPSLNAAVTRIRAGTGNAHSVFAGDSTTGGIGGTSLATSYPAVLAGLLSAPAGRLAVCGELGAGFDTRLTLGTGWAISAVGGWGNFSITGGGTVGAACAIAFPDSFDTVDIWYIRGFGSFDVNVGGATIATVDTSGSSAVAKATVRVPAGVHTLNIVGKGSAVWVLDVEPYLTTARALLVSNAGVGGTTTASWLVASNPWSLFAMFDYFQPDLTVISLGINDSGASVSVATFQANIQALITKAKLYGDVLLESMVPSSSPGFEPQYVTALAALAASNSCGLYDVNALFVDWATANGNGYMSDSLHPNTAGYSFWANGLNGAMAAIIQPAIANTVAPVASGIAIIGQVLSVTTGTFPGATSPTYGYQWQRDAGGSGPYSNIVGATSANYTLVSADAGCNVRSAVLLTASNGTGGAQSNAIGPVQPTTSSIQAVYFKTGA